MIRSFCELARADIGQLHSALLGIKHITIEGREAGNTALDLFDAGTDLAAALHLVRSGSAAAFFTVNRRLARRTKALGSARAVKLLM